MSTVLSRKKQDCTQILLTSFDIAQNEALNAEY